MQYCDSEGLLELIPHEFASVHVLTWVLLGEHVLQSVHDQDGVHVPPDGLIVNVVVFELVMLFPIVSLHLT
jgi:hypothetical protein